MGFVKTQGFDHFDSIEAVNNFMFEEEHGRKLVPPSEWRRKPLPLMIRLINAGVLIA